MSVKFTVEVTGYDKYIRITDLLNTDDKDSKRVQKIGIKAGDDEVFDVKRSVDSPVVGHVWFDAAKWDGMEPSEGAYRRLDQYEYPEDGRTYIITDALLS
jgi:hypothetical protein